MISAISPPAAPPPATAVAEPNSVEMSRGETDRAIAAADQSETSNSTAENGQDGGAGARSDGTFGASMEAAFARKAAEEQMAASANEESEAASDKVTEREDKERVEADMLRQQASDTYNATRDAIGMTN